MSLELSLITVRATGAMTASMQALVESYLARCRQVFSAEHRTFRTESALLTAAAAERKGGAIAFWIADLGGRDLSSAAFAEQVRTVRDGGVRNLLLAVGPADGWSQSARAAADLRFSLGPMTLPHELATLVLAEQIYRASTILQGHPYHLGH